MKTKKSLKPIDYDIHLKYICPICGGTHWLSWNESKTKNFKIVCDCGEVYRVKRVDSFKIKYASLQKVSPKPKTENNSAVPLTLLNKAIKNLMPYGFTESEASSMITDTYNKNPTNNLVELIKQTLEYFGENNGK